MVRQKELYRIIYDDLVEKISTGVYQIGDMLPFDSEIEEMFKTSRTPVRQALKQLENDGYIYRHQGKGSFVANFKPAGNWTLMTGFQYKYSSDWKRISARTIDVQQIVDPYYSKQLKVDALEKITRLRRIRYFDGDPVFYLEHYIIPSVSVEIFRRDPVFISVDQLLKDELNLEIFEVQEEIEAVVTNSEVTNLLEVRSVTPLLKVTRLSFDERYTPIDVTIYYVRTDKWKYIANFSQRNTSNDLLSK